MSKVLTDQERENLKQIALECVDRDGGWDFDMQAHLFEEVERLIAEKQAEIVEGYLAIIDLALLEAKKVDLLDDVELLEAVKKWFVKVSPDPNLLERERLKAIQGELERQADEWLPGRSLQLGDLGFYAKRLVEIERQLAALKEGKP